MEHTWIGVVAVLWLGAVVATVLYVRPDPVVDRDFLTARVLGSADTSSDAGFSVRFALEFPDGTPKSLSTASMSVAVTIIETACVERRTLSSGNEHFVLVPTNMCPE
ncbi:hypothetical protein [uncultured Tateyamaria sp.]|uniref:hypothetical protein n=1 Tax=uncultured Tateyamaria sp. TaxID=455651 RepID=UPI002613AE0C|nr:hypothetical protein [uncultured Tateyamaria sp.]